MPKYLFFLICFFIVSSSKAGEILVKFDLQNSFQAQMLTEQFLSARGGKVIHQYQIVPGLVRVAVEDIQYESLLNGLQLFTTLEYAIPNSKRRPAIYEFGAQNALFSPQDPPIPPRPGPLSGWVKDPKESQNYGIADYHNGSRTVWNKYGAIGNAQTIIAVLDTGVDYTHPDLLHNMWRNTGESGMDSNGQSKETNGVDDDENGYVDDVVGYDFVNRDSLPYDDQSHGTHVAGTAAAVGGNGLGIAGHCPRCSIMALKFISAEGWGTDADAILALEYAMNMGATVINSSWGGEEYNQALLDAFVTTSNAGIVNIVAAGNEGKNLDRDPVNQYPAEFDIPGLYTVSALYATNITVTWWSNYGRYSSHLSAAGDTVVSTLPGGKYGPMSGTSMATPGVAGCVGLMLSYRPELSFADLNEIFDKNVTGDPRSMSMVYYGGRLDMPRIFKGFQTP
ncbi:MAG: S8 family peptidase [Bdellovibrionales bacterium]